MNSDTLEIVERIVTAETDRYNAVHVGYAISTTLLLALDGHYSEARSLVRDLLIGFLSCGCYVAYMDAADEISQRYRTRWRAEGVFHPKSTRQILESPYELAGLDVVPFIRFLYEYTDEPWLVYARIEQGDP